MTAEMSKEHKVALVTGGSRGIGFGIASKLADEGWNVAINGMRPEDAVHEPLQKLREKGIRAIYCQGNIGNLDDHHKIIGQIRESLGPISLLVNNAGIAPRKRMDILVTTPESYDEVMDINLKGPFFLSQLVANEMIKAMQTEPGFKGCIINIGSISATVASPGRGEYCLSKAGMGMMNLLFASRLGEYDLPVYEVRPGLISTDMTSGVKGKYDTLIEQGITIQKRWGQPEDIGKAVAALARKDFPYSSGEVIMVDGGLTINRL